MTDLLVHLATLPDDWGSWLVYADQLTERGDDRGQLLVLEHRGDRDDRELVRLQADEWIATWGEHLGINDPETYTWIRTLERLADPPTPEDLLPVFGRPISQLIALFDLENPTPPDLSPIFRLHRERVFETTLAWIDRVFDGVPVPDADHLTIHQAEAADNYETCDRSRDHLGRWQDLPETHLLENQWALPYLDAQGIHYYLPAVMSFALRHRCPGDWIVESLGYSLQRYRGEPHGLFERLDPAQRIATYTYALVSGDALAAARWHPA